ncbi:hypothetical protein AB4Z45_27755 [Paenibacillus sp. MCAF9]|uniref:hypothetical protein n=1 Tax=Paenibacillus sp. MCAF9 TaxID=3233046 RepID=UPI003F9A2718
MLFKKAHIEVKQGIREHMLEEERKHKEALGELGKIQMRGNGRESQQNDSRQTKKES